MFPANDDVSSVYSRPPEVPKRALTWDLMPIILPIRHDLPEINSLDHQIAAAEGTTMALETTRTRVQSVKSCKRLSLSESREDKLRQRDQQEVENQFYRTCFGILRQLLIDVHEAVQILALQYYFEPEASPAGNEHVRQAVRELQTAVSQSRAHEAQAEEKWKRQWKAPEGGDCDTRWL